MSEWHDDDAFWLDIAPVVFTPERLNQAAADVEQLLALVKPPPGGSVLDLGCGVGRHSLELARRGYHVTGLDRTAEYLRRAGQAAAEQHAEIEWVQADMRKFRRDGAFDVVACLLTSFGYFENPTDDRRVLDNVFASLKPGGSLVIDLMGKEVLARIYRERDWQEHCDGVLLLEHRRVKDAWRRLEMRWIVLRGNQRREHRFSLRLYSADELQTLLHEVGFGRVDAYGSLAGTPYDHEAQRLALVARRG